ncbi:MAG: hypothetical protein PHR71_11865 [Polaromonas sp.]|nr:hypothetical protein [Polaromonas sp.]
MGLPWPKKITGILLVFFSAWTEPKALAFDTTVIKSPKISDTTGAIAQVAKTLGLATRAVSLIFLYKELIKRNF